MSQPPVANRERRATVRGRPGRALGSSWARPGFALGRIVGAVRHSGSRTT
ncbi:hypothetical protein ATKI12_1567 [Kitasatospora sp. Ki12]